MFWLLQPFKQFLFFTTLPPSLPKKNTELKKEKEKQSGSRKVIDFVANALNHNF